MYTPKIDAFGSVTINGSKLGDFRLIEISETELALFHTSQDPQVFTLGPSKYKTNARKLTATLGNGDELLFQRAGCGCQTPANLRGPRSKFVSTLTPADV